MKKIISKSFYFEAAHKLSNTENEENKKKWDSILASRLEGQKLGVNSTPSFIFNGKKLEGSVDLKVLLKHIY